MEILFLAELIWIIRKLNRKKYVIWRETSFFSAKKEIKIELSLSLKLVFAVVAITVYLNRLSFADQIKAKTMNKAKEIKKPFRRNLNLICTRVK